ncbi:MAG: HD domain-containing protein [Marinifilaceae bacterium]|jgi:(p)ppGpp synthase/HD superfamily hydrolase|nr:HD domain-containing protein [Marinifilaceae bacterium]
MIQEIYQKTISFAAEKHKKQFVPGTEYSYVVHLSNLAMELFAAYQYDSNFDLAYAVQLALLHDTIEDTQTEYKELHDKFGEKVAIGVSALTKNKSLGTKQEMILDSLARINKLEKEVGIVKLCDRITNLQKPPKHWDKIKIHKYLNEAKTILDQLKMKNKYLEDRLLSKIKEYEKYL